MMLFRLVRWLLRRLFWLVFFGILFFLLSIWLFAPQVLNLQRPNIAELRQELAPAVDESITDVIVEDSLMHYYVPGSDIGPEKVAAHCHSSGVICIKSKTLNSQPFSLWHEAAHAYTFHLRRQGSDFLYRWIEIGEGSELDSYGQTDSWEDVAVWVEHVYLEANGYFSYFDNLGWESSLFGRDLDAYRQKLQLLRIYGFITEEDYRNFIQECPLLKPQTAELGSAVFDIIDKMLVILHNIRSLYNVGSIFRTADAAGVEKLYLCGITPAPVDRFGNIRPQLAKVALGAEKSVAWEKCASATRLIDKLKKSGYKILAIEQSAKSIPYFELPKSYILNSRFCLVLGSEVKGLPATILQKADKILEIPMRGKKESLNVAVAFGIVAFQLIR